MVRHKGLLALGMLSDYTDDIDDVSGLLNHEDDLIKESCQAAIMNLEKRFP